MISSLIRAFHAIVSIAWNVTYASLSKLVSAQSTYPKSLAFGSGGTKMFILSGSDKTVYQYTLSTAWNVSTATYASLSKLVSAETTESVGLAFSSDGTKMFILGNGNATVYQYTLSTAWNVSTAVYASLSKSVESQDVSPFGLAFSSDGTKMFISGSSNKTVYQYTLSTAWNVSTAVYASLSKSVSAETNSWLFAFSSDGTKMFILGSFNKTVYQYTLSTAWNVSTATYASLSKLVSAETNSPYGLAFSSDVTKMFILGQSDATVYQYTL